MAAKAVAAEIDGKLAFVPDDQVTLAVLGTTFEGMIAVVIL
ncbi:MAG TPA: hypothetical protein VGU71_13325 [Candidatus Dormibacteraeota bacterium]|nr:hypothetical protein [Candidatus Dormibacteraeota bacterium]